MDTQSSTLNTNVMREIYLFLPPNSNVGVYCVLILKCPGEAIYLFYTLKSDESSPPDGKLKEIKINLPKSKVEVKEPSSVVKNPKQRN